jgi:hypothetical protein
MRRSASGSARCLRRLASRKAAKSGDGGYRHHPAQKRAGQPSKRKLNHSSCSKQNSWDTMVMNRKQHWEKIYRKKSATEVSWYQAHPKRSLDLIRATGLPKDARMLSSLLPRRIRAPYRRCLHRRRKTWQIIVFWNKGVNGLSGSAIRRFSRSSVPGPAESRLS